jgi:DNA adenine methylase
MKPFLKWVGGKTQILDSVLGNFPDKIHDYHEIFVGGGSVLFSVLDRCNVNGKLYAYDLNKTLIQVYKDVQSRPMELHTEIMKLFNVYDGLIGTDINRKPSNENEAMTSKESYYYWIRHLYNTGVGDRSAMFIFLNKTCFRGVFREGPNGFNVPYGHYKSTPQFLTVDEFKNISTKLQRVEFKHCDFRDAIARVKSDDFMYLDPPYAPETKTSFVGYTKDGFGLEDHETLFKMIKTSGAQFVMSNAGVDLVRNAFCDYKIHDVKARRAINSKNPDATTTEVLVLPSNQI